MTEDEKRILDGVGDYLKSLPMQHGVDNDALAKLLRDVVSEHYGIPEENIIVSYDDKGNFSVKARAPVVSHDEFTVDIVSEGL